MKEQKVHAAKVAFYTCLLCSIGLLIGGFFAPPMGVVDNSVLAAAGLLLMFAVVAIWGRSVDLGNRAELRKGDLSITIDNDGADSEEDSQKG